MGKKKKKAIKMAEANIKVLKSGKVKISKNQKIDLKPFVEKSVENSIVSRLDGIISKENVVIETADCRMNTTVSLTSTIKTAELISKVTDAVSHTVAITVSKKDATDVFDFVDMSTLGNILRTSTLASIYKEIKHDWVELNEDDKTGFTNVMFVPGILVFIDETTGKFRKTPYVINLLLVAEPSVTKMNVTSDSTDVEKLTDEEVVSRIVVDVVETGIKCGCKHMIVDPFDYKQLLKDPHETAKCWNQIITTQRCIEQYDSIDFSVEDDDLYVIFNAQRLK